MRNLTKEFKNRKVIIENLIPNGFIKKDDTYIYEKDILNNEFKVVITISNTLEIISKVIELSLNDEYLLVDVPSASGEFVGKVKEKYDKVINEIITNCTTLEVFKNDYTKEVIKYVKDKYNDDLEFLWVKFDNNAVWRNKKNNKWYAALLIVKEEKLGLSGNTEIEIIDLMYQKDQIEKIIDYKKIFPGYHMNKKSWITIKLDGSMPLEELYKLLDNSYNISLNK